MLYRLPKFRTEEYRKKESEMDVVCFTCYGPPFHLFSICSLHHAFPVIFPRRRPLRSKVPLRVHPSAIQRYTKSGPFSHKSSIQSLVVLFYPPRMSRPKAEMKKYSAPIVTFLALFFPRKERRNIWKSPSILLIIQLLIVLPFYPFDLHSSQRPFQ